MNEIVIVSAITSCVWAVAVATAFMYRRLKKMVEMLDSKIENLIGDVYRSKDEAVSELRQQIGEIHCDADRKITDLQRYIDSRIDKAQLKNNKASK